MSDACERSVKICTFEQHNRLCICMFLNVYRLSKVTRSVSVTSWRIVKKTHTCQRSTIQIQDFFFLRFILFSPREIKMNDFFTENFNWKCYYLFSIWRYSEHLVQFSTLSSGYFISMLQCKVPVDFLFLKSKAVEGGN